VGLGRLAEEVLPKMSDCFLARVHSAVGGWASLIEDAIVAHKLHHTPDIMAVESLIEGDDGPHHRFYLGHPEWAHIDKITPGIMKIIEL
jgi:hypothetical protein